MSDILNQPYTVEVESTARIPISASSAKCFLDFQEVEVHCDKTKKVSIRYQNEPFFLTEKFSKVKLK